MLTRHDKILALAIVLVAALGFIFFAFFTGDTEPQNRIVIEAMGEVVQVIPMDQLEPGKEIPITGPLGDSILQMGEDKVRLVDSPCPDHICLHMGWISKPGEVIVCLPNMIMIRVEGEEPERDGITR